MIIDRTKYTELDQDCPYFYFRYSYREFFYDNSEVGKKHEKNEKPSDYDHAELQLIYARTPEAKAFWTEIKDKSNSKYTYDIHKKWPHPDEIECRGGMILEKQLEKEKKEKEKKYHAKKSSINLYKFHDKDEDIINIVDNKDDDIINFGNNSHKKQTKYVKHDTYYGQQPKNNKKQIKYRSFDME